MKIALASPPYPKSIADGLYWIEKLVKDAALQGAVIVCFPESYLPGYPGLGFVPEEAGAEKLQDALNKVCEIAKDNSIAIIMPMDLYKDDRIYNVAQVIGKEGEVLGYQTKNQLDPSEDDIWSPGTKRQLFEVDGLKFGLTICHEGFRYPESVRWAAQQGAHLVFHPHLAGSDIEGTVPTEWGSMNNPYYEKAMMMRALENTIYFASCNYATKYPESASSIIAPNGEVLAHAPYTEVGVTVADIGPDKATGYLAKRFKNRLYNGAVI
ncbi:carbon-nitrogen hydrolase family protein [Mucilaginibacter myungsuensis]|uniref:Carbon-nitrogen hydrolase family protein n=1 Tax=Mucilaginibacter myungsuensis TaxID=649104 RepID=A0A929KZR9_9SPHI|nr:carbon-nitrogen hydrolase family protein [Mucilaginibacter myungsuensis]MBE9660661.1 carbon-nitrogen hydrolase family protein [Mucilaginibacter myungsuensis]MDN3600706.1 carbon-nitrogen hydrolase family protein [Mucilaginibacter myungsuensis]